jgi:hypothetical protein
MSWFRKPIIFVLTIALGSSVLAAKKEDAAKKTEKTDKKKDKKKDDPGPKGDAPAAEGTVGADGKPKISVPIPPGHDARGLVIPYRDAEGKMQMRFTMEVGKRTDADHMDMTKLLIQTYDDEGKEEMKIDLPQSLLDLNTRVITTESGVVIKRSDFELTGDAMKFNTETKAGTIRGIAKKVRMLIYNLDNETDTKPAGAAASK